MIFAWVAVALLLFSTMPDFRRHAEVGVHSVAQVLAALREVHFALAVHQLVDGDVTGG